MSDNLDSLLGGFENQTYNLDITQLATRLLYNSIKSNEYLRTIIGQQLEIKELIKGTSSDIDEVVDEKYAVLMEKIDELVQKDFLSTVTNITKG
ncbi:hypothetical protein [Pontibacter sp. HSC-36F09]|uniref:hypothetical protein n=1 Tax=Pontibacter sp. HSC-36F09 TaxID=2910966 RepID=UPI00209FDAB8|nr:hypothetical protein [Pontibacter sp. HSC-36F09]MCP2042074.1 putative ATP-binding protein involved in virulence [Pontibacter sp. HSC-36F09]